MKLTLIKALAKMTIGEPKMAAQVLTSVPLSREVKWTALVLAAVLNSLLTSMILRTQPPVFEIPQLAYSPLVLFVVVTIFLICNVFAIFLAAQVLGGGGKVENLALLLGWYQMLRVVAQLVILGVGMILPPGALLLSLAVLVWGIWVQLHFVRAATKLPSLARAAGAMVIGLLGLIMALSFVISLFITVFYGGAANV